MPPSAPFARFHALMLVFALAIGATGCGTQPTRQPEPVEPQVERATHVYSEDDDTWQRLRDGMEMRIPDRPEIEQTARWYANRPAVMERMQTNASWYLFHIVESIEKRGLPLELALLPAVESNFNPMATSRSGAAGLWQFMRPTGRLYGLDQNLHLDERRCIVDSTEAALDYLVYLNRMFDGDWELALASYNAGPGTVSRARARNERDGRPLDYWSLDLPAETKDYVPRLYALAKIVAHPGDYGVRLARIPNRPRLAQIETRRSVDLKRAALASGIDHREFQVWNAAYTDSVTTARKSHRLFVPAEKADLFRTALAELPEVAVQPPPPPKPAARPSRRSYTVRPGDTLYKVARQIAVPVDTLRRENKIRGNIIRPGQTLGYRSNVKANAPRTASRSSAPATKKVAAKTGPAKAPPPPTVAAAPNRSYRVKSGDTLWSIAKAHSVALDALCRHNRLTTKAVLNPGQVLRIPELREASMESAQSAS